MPFTEAHFENGLLKSRPRVRNTGAISSSWQLKPKNTPSRKANTNLVIRNYQASIEDEGLEPCVDVGINVGTNEQRVLELIRMNSRITAKEIAESLSISLRQGERIMATLKEKGLIKRVGSYKSGHPNAGRRSG